MDWVGGLKEGGVEEGDVDRVVWGLMRLVGSGWEGVGG